MKKMVLVSVLLVQGMEAAERARPEDYADYYQRREEIPATALISLEDASEQASLRDEKNLLQQLAQVRTEKAPLEGISEREELSGGAGYGRELASKLDGLRKKEMALLVFLIDATKESREVSGKAKKAGESADRLSLSTGDPLTDDTNRVAAYENELAELVTYLDARTKTIFEKLTQVRNAKEGALQSKHTLEKMGGGWGALGQDPEHLIAIYQQDENKALQAIARLLKT